MDWVTRATGRCHGGRPHLDYGIIDCSNSTQACIVIISHSLRTIKYDERRTEQGCDIFEAVVLDLKRSSVTNLTTYLSCLSQAASQSVAACSSPTKTGVSSISLPPQSDMPDSTPARFAAESHIRNMHAQD